MKTILIDVRTAKEYSEGSYPGAINLPSGDFNVNDFQAYRYDHISLICFSGNRASQIQSKLQANGFEEVSLMQNQMAVIQEGEKKTKNVWTVDRQFRLALGILLGIFLVGNYIFDLFFTDLLVGVLFTGLIYSAISDNCYLKAFIGILPWNRPSSTPELEIISERD